MKNSKGDVNSLRSPPFTPSKTGCLPFANYMTDLSRIAFVGETAKLVTAAATILPRNDFFSQASIIKFMS